MSEIDGANSKNDIINNNNNKNNHDILTRTPTDRSKGTSGCPVQFFQSALLYLMSTIIIIIYIIIIIIMTIFVIIIIINLFLLLFYYCSKNLMYSNVNSASSAVHQHVSGSYGVMMMMGVRIMIGVMM